MVKNVANRIEWDSLGTKFQFNDSELLEKIIKDSKVPE